MLRGEGPLAFCSGGDQSVRSAAGGYVGADGIPRLNVLDLQMQVGIGEGSDPGYAIGKYRRSLGGCLLFDGGASCLVLRSRAPLLAPLLLLPACVQIRRLPKPVIASVAGYAVGGGHILHMVCDLTIAADNAVFGQTGPKVGSFDAGYGSTQVPGQGCSHSVGRHACTRAHRGVRAGVVQGEGVSARSSECADTTDAALPVPVPVQLHAHDVRLPPAPSACPLPTSAEQPTSAPPAPDATRRWRG